MVRLENIAKIDNVIECDAFVEDCCDAVHLSFNVNNKELAPYELPVDYEWCTSNIVHAKRFLRSLVNANEIPKERLIMWY